MIFIEAESFRPATSSVWQQVQWGYNYFAAPYSNTLLSGNAALSAPPECDESEATATVVVPGDDRYMILVRYEAPYRFETQFRLFIDQYGTNIFMYHYGSRDSQRLWGFGRGITEEALWPWGPIENIVWEGHTAFANLLKGPATLRLVAGHQQYPQARRNIDLILLTTDTNRVSALLNNRESSSPLALDVLAGTTRIPKIIPEQTADTLNYRTPGQQGEATNRIDHERFRKWLRKRVAEPSEIDPAFDKNWEFMYHSPNPSTAEYNPWLYSLSRQYSAENATLALTAPLLASSNTVTNIIVNYTQEPDSLCLGPVYSWIAPYYGVSNIIPRVIIRPWRLPVGTSQMATIQLDMLRSSQRNRSSPRIIWIPDFFTPPATGDYWWRILVASVAHGMRDIEPIISWFRGRPNSDNPLPGVSRELEILAPLLSETTAPPTRTAILFSETGDLWDDLRHPFDAGKRTLFIAIRHQQLPLDILTEKDISNGHLTGYRLLFVTDQHLSEAAAGRIAAWVESGGVVVATMGGILDEFNRSNIPFENLLGLRAKGTETPIPDMVAFEKADLPFTKPIDHVSLSTNRSAIKLSVFSGRTRVAVRSAEIIGKFDNGTPAITVRNCGAGKAWWFGFMPGLTYFKPAIPLRPVDQSMATNSMTHFLPTIFDTRITELLETICAGIDRPVICSDPLVESAQLIRTNCMLIPLINWRGDPNTNLVVTIPRCEYRTITSIAGATLQVATNSDKATIVTLPLSIADVLILR